MKLKWSITLLLVLVFALSTLSSTHSMDSSHFSSTNPSKKPPKYFIAIHNEPLRQELQENLDILNDMVSYANERNIHLTLMFTPQWIPLLTEPENKPFLAQWKEQGHEISAHHHGIRHGGWDGYTNYSPETSQKQRWQEIHFGRSQVKHPETYLGTLEDAMNIWQAINPDIHTGCMNAEFDKNEIPQGITIDTSSGFMNTGMIGVRKRNDGTSPRIGINDYILQGSIKDQTIHWLSHFLPGRNPSILPALFSTFSSCSENSVYGLVFHSSSGELPIFQKCIDFLHQVDSEGNHSYTLQEVVHKNHLPIEILPAPFLGESTTQKTDAPPIGFHPASINHPSFSENGYAHAYHVGVNMTREGVYAFWPLVQPDLKSSLYNFQMYDLQWFSVPSNISILGNISAQPSMRDYGRFVPGTWIPIDIPSYKEFVKAVVERYDGDGIDDMPGLMNPIRYWQVGNEPNLSHQLRSPRSDYATYQKITYEAIKEANPDAFVLMAGVAGFPDSYMRGFDTFYPAVLQELNGQYIDGFDFHWYGNAFGEYQFVDTMTGQNVLKEIRKTLVDAGFSETLPIWITEMGTYAGVLHDPLDWNTYQTEEQQATDLVKRCFYSWANGIEQVLMAFGFMEGFRHDAGYFDHTVFIYDGEGFFDQGLGVKKLGYFTMKLLTQEFQGLKPSQVILIQSDDNISLYKWNAPDGKPTYILWRNDNPGILAPAMEVTLKNTVFANAQSVTTIEMVPDAFIGKGLETQDFNSLFRTQTHASNSSGTFTIPIQRAPLLMKPAE
jgi:hypothetical protein